VALLVWSSQIEGCSRSDELTGALMARRTFDVPDVTVILVQWDAGRSRSEIATSLGLGRKTVKKYLTPAIEGGLSPGRGRWPAEWATRVRVWFPQLADTRLRQISWPRVEQHPRLHRRPARGWCHEAAELAAATRRARPDRERGVVEAADRGEPAR
jgi:hypothetical protein